VTPFKLKQNRTLNFIFPVSMLTFFIIGYYNTFQKLSIHWSKGDNNYCYLIVPIFLYLCWEERKHFRFHQFSWSPLGVFSTFLSITLIIIGELGSVITLVYVGIWGCLVGMFITIYGMRVRLLLFPLLILFFIVPLPPFVNRLLTFKLKIAASTLSIIMLRVFNVSVFQNGNIIDLGISQLQVVDACSGLRFLMPLLLMSLLVGYFFCKGWGRRAILLAIVPPLSIFVNSLRIFVTGMLTVKGHPELAQSFFHDFSGWLIFMVAAAILLAAAFTIKKIGSNKKGSSGLRLEAGGKDKSKASLRMDAEDKEDSKAIGWIRQIVLTLILCFLFASSGWALKMLPSARNLPERTSFSSFPMQIGQWQGKRHYISKEILDQLWADDYVSAIYIRPDLPNYINLLIPFYEYQGTRHTAHAPQSCMIGSGWALFNTSERLINMNPKGKIKIMTMTWEKENFKLLASYFFFQRGRVITNPWMNKFYLMWDMILKQRTDGALVRVEMTVVPQQSMDEAYSVLEDFITKIWPILPEYVPA